MDTTTFPAAPLDPYAERITSGLSMLGGILILPALFWYLSGIAVLQIVATGVVISAAVAFAILVFVMLNYAFQPTSYQILADRLVIRRRWARRVQVPFSQIAGVSSASALADLPRRGLRRAFNAGVFGYHGPFQLEPYGRVFFSATHRERLVAIARFERMPLLISPNRPRDFVEALRDALQTAKSEAATETRVG